MEHGTGRGARGGSFGPAADEEHYVWVRGGEAALGLERVSGRARAEEVKQLYKAAAGTGARDFHRPSSPLDELRARMPGPRGNR